MGPYIGVHWPTVLNVACVATHDVVLRQKSLGGRQASQCCLQLDVQALVLGLVQVQLHHHKARLAVGVCRVCVAYTMVGGSTGTCCVVALFEQGVLVRHGAG